MADLDKTATAYEILGVHSSAPAELISACYWAMAGDLQKKRATEPEADAELHLLTRVYQSISDPDRRAEYNLSINSAKEPLTKRALPRRRFFLFRPFRRNRYSVNWYVDPHEVLGLHPSAPQSVVPAAYRLMRDAYLRLPPGSRRQETLLDLLDESYAVLGDPQRRAQLAGVGPAEEQMLPSPARDESPITDAATEGSLSPPESQVRVPDETVAAGAAPEDAPARDDSPVGDLRESTQSDVAEAKVELPMTDPAPREPVRTQLRIPDGPVAAGAGREDGSAERQAAPAIVAVAAAATGTVARGVLWVAMAVAALIVVVALFVGRSLRSGWLSASEWLRRSWEERQGEARDKRIAQDEEFLGRLSSTVEKSKIEPPVKRRD